MEAFFGDKHSFPGIDNLKHIARVGVPVDVLSGGDLAKELAYENHSSAETNVGAVWDMAVAAVAGGRAIGFPKEQAGQVPRLRVSPVGVVEEGEKDKSYSRYDFRGQERARGGGP